VSHQAKWEYLSAIYRRYRQASRIEKQRILDEFCRVTGYHRKHALRRLNGPLPSPQPIRRRHRVPPYGPEVIRVLAVIWEAAGFPWSLRLKALLPLWLPWVRKRVTLSAKIEQQLLTLSPRQMDRRLHPYKRRLKRRLYGRTKPGTLLKHHIPLKTDRWDVTTPGFTEVDLVSHSGPSAAGEFIHSLNLTDIHTTWDETRAVMGKGQARVQHALGCAGSTIAPRRPWSACWPRPRPIPSRSPGSWRSATAWIPSSSPKPSTRSWSASLPSPSPAPRPSPHHPAMTSLLSRRKPFGRFPRASVSPSPSVPEPLGPKRK